jgi:hypothetical protein
MGALDPRVSQALDELVPPRPGPDGWDAIVGAAGERPGRRRWVAAALPVAAVAAAALVALAWPFDSSGPQGTILERAAAAIGDGPVLHAVIKQGWGGTLVDLKSGERRKARTELEVWYDPARGIRETSRFEGVVEYDGVIPPGRVEYLEKTLGGIATGYREALENGTARVLEDGVVEGEPVHWIRVDTKMLPDVADGKLHEWAHDVAVSKETAEVVATRETRDREVSPGGISIVLEAETLPAGAGDFDRRLSEGPEGPFSFNPVGEESLTRSEASAVLGRPALWAGPRVGDLELARIWKDVRRERDGRDGPWREYYGVSVFYGVVDADGKPAGIDGPSEVFQRHAWIRQSVTRDLGFRAGTRNWVPPAGVVYLAGPGSGLMAVDGIHVVIQASNEELVLAAARALEPVPEG